MPNKIGGQKPILTPLSEHSLKPAQRGKPS
jgi:hypothetical protein